jgi:hypothetical protein
MGAMKERAVEELEVAHDALGVTQHHDSLPGNQHLSTFINIYLLFNFSFSKFSIMRGL